MRERLQSKDWEKKTLGGESIKGGWAKFRNIMLEMQDQFIPTAYPWNTVLTQPETPF